LRWLELAAMIPQAAAKMLNPSCPFHDRVERVLDEQSDSMRLENPAELHPRRMNDDKAGSVNQSIHVYSLVLTMYMIPCFLLHFASSYFLMIRR
jgi:hypothetical protein